MANLTITLDDDDKKGIADFCEQVGMTISGLYNDMKIDAVSIAKFGQFAENDYFGKPCGLPSSQ